MKLFFKNYRFTLILLGAIIIGGAAGLVFGTKTTVVKPFGDLFLNLMFMIIVPLVFFSIASAIANMNEMKRLGKIMGSIVLVFLLTAFVAAVLGLTGASIIHPIENADISAIKKVMTEATVNTKAEHVPFLSQLVNTFTVSDFN
ncbi:cation:dicarboxylase symporter family transporter, partial [Alkalihalophilus lindianensis]